jgi:predicted GIY-YIG superfamily endonuclease
MNEAELKSAIERKRGSLSYSDWYIGITDDTKRRRAEHENEGKICIYWSDWKADSEAIARNVEAYFIDRGMKGGTGGGEHPTYVYVF